MDTTTLLVLVLIGGGILYVVTRGDSTAAGRTLGTDPVDQGSMERTAYANALSALAMAAGSIAGPLLANRTASTTTKQMALSGGKAGV